MCGRLVIYSLYDDIAEMFQVPELPPLRPRFNVAPSQDVLVIRRLPDDPARHAALLRWGLIPTWATDPAMGARMINARAESVADKPAYRRPFREKRCLIPADGFYEWQHCGVRKQPFFIRLKERAKGLFAMAGLWESWRGATGESVESFTIVTTAANETVRPVHDRMPLILDPKDYDMWLDPAVKEPAVLQPLLQPFPADRLVAVPVGAMVNDPQHDSPQCIEPVAEMPAPLEASPRRRKKDGGQQMLF